MRCEQLSPNITMYHGDCRDVIPTLSLPVDAVVTDPPYGLAELWQGGKKEWPLHHVDSEGMDWDAAPFDDIESIVALGRDAIIWGGHLYRLPPARGWLVWDKKTRGFTSGDFELAWSTLDQPIHGITIARNVLTPVMEGKEHPTQKPIGLMKWCLQQVPNALTILDPFAGSGTTGVAAAQMSRGFIGIERQQSYFNIACRRISQALSQPDLFAVGAKPEKPPQLQL